MNNRETNSTKLAHSFFSTLGLFTIPNSDLQVRIWLVLTKDEGKKLVMFCVKHNDLPGLPLDVRLDK
jgi:hypothetical protein